MDLSLSFDLQYINVFIFTFYDSQSVLEGVQKKKKKKKKSKQTEQAVEKAKDNARDAQKQIPRKQRDTYR